MLHAWVEVDLCSLFLNGWLRFIFCITVRRDRLKQCLIWCDLLRCVADYLLELLSSLGNELHNNLAGR